MKSLLPLALALTSAPAMAQLITGAPYAIDGDTLDMDGLRIRLHGIDAPEAAQTCQRGEEAWPCGQEAKKVLTALVTGRQVECEQKGLDGYGRIVAVCHAGQIDLANEQARAGLAVALPQYSQAYIESEAAARAKRIGIWGSIFELPTDYRRAHPQEFSPAARPSTTRRGEQAAPTRSSVYYRNCNEARAAGAAPLYRGEPGYRPEMAGDGDGIACEPYRGRR